MRNFDYIVLSPTQATQEMLSYLGDSGWEMCGNRADGLVFKRVVSMENISSVDEYNTPIMDIKRQMGLE